MVIFNNTNLKSNTFLFFNKTGQNPIIFSQLSTKFLPLTECNLRADNKSRQAAGHLVTVFVGAQWRIQIHKELANEFNVERIGVINHHRFVQIVCVCSAFFVIHHRLVHWIRPSSAFLLRHNDAILVNGELFPFRLAFFIAVIDLHTERN